MGRRGRGRGECGMVWCDRENNESVSVQVPCCRVVIHVQVASRLLSGWFGPLTRLAMMIHPVHGYGVAGYLAVDGRQPRSPGRADVAVWWRPHGC